MRHLNKYFFEIKIICTEPFEFSNGFFAIEEFSISDGCFAEYRANNTRVSNLAASTRKIAQSTLHAYSPVGLQKFIEAYLQFEIKRDL